MTSRSLAALALLLVLPALSAYEKAPMLPDAPEDWVAQSLRWVDRILGEHPPAIPEHPLRRTALIRLDDILNIEPVTASPAAQAFYQDRMERAIGEIETAIVTEGARVWKLFNHGFFIRTPAVSIVFDLNRGRPVGAGFAISSEQIARIVDQADAAFVSHWHGDHFDLEAIERFLSQGKPVLAPPDGYGGRLAERGLQTPGQSVVRTHAVSVGAGAGVLEVVVYPGLHGRGGRPINNVYLVTTPDRFTVIHTGDQASPEEPGWSFDWIMHVGQQHAVDLALPNVWTTNLARTVHGFRPRLVIPGHENEMGHAPAQRQDHGRAYHELGASPYPFLVLAWGESFHMDSSLVHGAPIPESDWTRAGIAIPDGEDSGADYTALYSSGEELYVGGSTGIRRGAGPGSWETVFQFDEADGRVHAIASGRGGSMVASHSVHGVFRSDDGSVWERAEAFPGSVVLRDLQYRSGRWIGVGHRIAEYRNQLAVAFSPDGRRWEAQDPFDEPLTGSFAAVQFGNGIFVAAGGDRLVVPRRGFLYDAEVVAAAVDATVWEPVVAEFVQRVYPQEITPPTAVRADVAYGNGTFLTARDDEIAISSNGRDWESVATAAFPVEAVRFAHERFFLLGRYGQVSASAEGRRWTDLRSGAGVRLNDVVYHDGDYILAGDAGVLLRMRGSTLRRMTTPDAEAPLLAPRRESGESDHPGQDWTAPE